MDLSALEGFSVNDGIDECQCSLKYASVEEALQKIAELGRGSLLWGAE